jgi:hypothetical protein
MPPLRARDIAVNHHRDQLYNALYHDRYSKKGSSSQPEDVEQAADDDAFQNTKMQTSEDVSMPDFFHLT